MSANEFYINSVLLAVILGSINITMLAPHSIDFTRAASAAGQLFKLIDRESSIDPLDQSGVKPSEILGHVTLENVSFAYPTRPDTTVLENFSLDVPAGKVTALVVSVLSLSRCKGYLANNRSFLGSKWLWKEYYRGPP